MQYTFEYEERISKINEITIDVVDEDEAEEILDSLEDKMYRFDHPDDILLELEDMGVRVLEYCEGAENCEYELI